MGEVVNIAAQRLRSEFLRRYKKPSTEASESELVEFLDACFDPKTVTEQQYFTALGYLTGENQ